MKVQNLVKLVPLFTLEAAIKKVRLSEDNWNRQKPEKVCLSYTEDTQWRNRSEFVNGRQEVVEFLKKKCRNAVRFAYEYQDLNSVWFRPYGNQNWEFYENGLMKKRYASINDLQINESDRKIFWSSGQPRPDDYKSLTELGL
ncbi:hypothetical protein ABPG72_001625 [Tetrahymena utriculariae]